MIKEDTMQQAASATQDKKYVALMFFTMKDSWFDLPPAKRQALTSDHVGSLAKFTGKVSITHLAGTGLSKYDLIEILEADDIAAIDDMIGQFKAGAKARYGELRELIVWRKGSANWSDLPARDCGFNQRLQVQNVLSLNLTRGRTSCT
jgi:chlorite dismutase